MSNVTIYHPSAIVHERRGWFTHKPIDPQVLVDLTNQHTALVEAEMKNVEVQRQAWEAPQKADRELAVQRAKHVETMRQLQHEHQVAEIQRATEITKVMAALVDAEQQLQAQRDHGYYIYELAHQKQRVEMLNIELSAAERRKLLERQDGEAPQQLPDLRNASNEIINEVLHTYRDYLNAAGADTSRVEAAIKSLR